MRGFTLIEMAVALAVMAALVGVGIQALRVQTQRAFAAEARFAMEEARTALFGFAAVNSRLPCPDSDGDGLENLTAGVCDVFSDATKPRWLPYHDLGLALPPGESLPNRPDWLRYTVSGSFAVAANLKTTTPGEIDVNDHTSTIVPKTTVAFALWWLGDDKEDTTSSAVDAKQVYVSTADHPGDDTVTWVSRYVLLGKMIDAGWSPPP